MRTDIIGALNKLSWFIVVKNTARFFKYVWPFYNIMHEKVNMKAFLF